jgi:NAD(P)-dependent dehydrogenase (short-subunit alcohol dehydrogenase family)
MRLVGKVAFITGGNSGIGLATARRFITEGAKVAIVGRSKETLREAASTLGSDLLPLQADLRDVKAIDACVEKAVSAFGNIDIVFANAGASSMTPIGDTTLDAFNIIIETNLTGVFFTVQAAASHMNDGGSIILNGSVHAVMGWPYFSAYAATKGAVRSMTRVMASKLAGRRIRVNQVTPGATNTPLWSRLLPNAEQVAGFCQLSRRQVQAVGWSLESLRRPATHSELLRCGEGSGSGVGQRKFSDLHDGGNGESSVTRRRPDRRYRPIVGT